MSSQRLTEKQVTEAQHDLGIVFPAEYRDYLVRNNSAEGPIAQLRKTNRRWWWADNPWENRALLTTPFPHPDSYLEEERVLDESEPAWADFVDNATYDEARRAWDQECERFQARKTAGAIIAQEHGCGFYTLLVLVGPLAGTVWWDGRASCDLIVPLSVSHQSSARPATLREWLSHNSWSLLPPGWGSNTHENTTVRDPILEMRVPFTRDI